VTFFVAGNVVGQNYFSPQSAAYLLAIVVFGVAFGRRTECGRLSTPEWVISGVCLVAMAVTHQLTPYMVAGALVALSLFGFTRSRWLIALALLPAAAWAAVNEHYVKEFVKPDQFGHIVSNVAPPGQLYPSFHKDLTIHLSVAGQVVGLLPIGIVALLVLLSRRDRFSAALTVAAATGLGLIVFSSYGQEGILRVVLFALPWVSLLAASEGKNGWAMAVDLAGIVIVPVIVLGFLFAIMGLDYYYAVRTDDVAMVRSFENSAPSGSLLFTIGNAYLPVELTARYSDFHLYDYPDVAATGTLNGKFNAQIAVNRFTEYLVGSENTHIRYYAITGEQPRAQLASVGLASVQQYNDFASALQKSPDWMVVGKSGESTLYILIAR